MLRGLPEGNCYEARRVFAERMAALLNEEPDCFGTEPERERLLYNLLNLCAAIADQREILGPPLYKMYNRQKFEGTLEGCIYQDIRISECLRAAVTPNQINRNLRQDWISMLTGDRVTCLLGNPFDGLQGLIWLPVSEKPG